MKRESGKIGTWAKSHRTQCFMSTSLSFHNLRSSSRVEEEVRCMEEIVWFRIVAPKIKYLPTSRLLLTGTFFIRSLMKTITIPMKNYMSSSRVHLLLKLRWSTQCCSILSIRVWKNAKTMKIKWWRPPGRLTHSCCILQRKTWYQAFRSYNSLMVRKEVRAHLMELEVSRVWNHQFSKSWEIWIVSDIKKLKELSCYMRPLKRSRLHLMSSFHA